MMQYDIDPCDRCDGEDADCLGCSHHREWIEEQEKSVDQDNKND